ncbi:hypothetical protein MRX96_018282 [Rhipicephalus microplus]
MCFGAKKCQVVKNNLTATRPSRHPFLCHTFYGKQWRSSGLCDWWAAAFGRPLTTSATQDKRADPLGTSRLLIAAQRHPRNKAASFATCQPPAGTAAHRSARAYTDTSASKRSLARTT